MNSERTQVEPPMTSSRDLPEPGKAIVTACSRCARSEATASQFEGLAGVPLCAPCQQLVTAFPVPRWVRIFFSATAAIVILSFVVQLRFVLGYVDLKRGSRALGKGDLTLASRYFGQLAQRIPENREARAVASYFEAIQLLGAKKPAQALEKLRSNRNAMPKGFNSYELELITESSIAFDEKDYDKLLSLSGKIRAQDDSAKARTMVVSALACKAATTGDLSTRQRALAELNALGNAMPQPEFTAFEQRMKHRLATRDIIDSVEYAKRFPQGWHEPESAGAQP